MILNHSSVGGEGRGGEGRKMHGWMIVLSNQGTFGEHVLARWGKIRELFLSGWGKD
jgi:hypothetical protein